MNWLGFRCARDAQAPQDQQQVSLADPPQDPAKGLP
jgi:hypothetical protein